MLQSPPPTEFLPLDADDGLRLAAERQPGRGPSVLLAHGFGQTRQSWAGTLAQLRAAGHAALAWDMRGHGQSGRNPPDRPYAADQFRGDVLRAAAALPGRPVLVGASMGGLTGLMAQARARPFSALVLVDVTPRWEPAGVERILGFMTAFPDGFDSFEHASDAIASYLPHRRARKTPAQLSSLLRDEGDGRLRWHWDPRLIGEFVHGSERLQDEISAAAREIDVPVLLVSGGRSDIVSERTIEHFLDLVPQARHVHLADASHMVAGDDNDAFSRALLQFLGAQFPQAAGTSGPAPDHDAIAATGAR